MPRYYFHIRHATSQIDKVGEELPDKEAAWKEAVSTAAVILKDAGTRMVPDGSPLRVQVTDEFQTPLFELRISGKIVI